MSLYRNSVHFGGKKAKAARREADEDLRANGIEPDNRYRLESSDQRDHPQDSQDEAALRVRRGDKPRR